ncbi:MAG: hypothetical protein J6C28_07565 [Bacilli bacterium]|nr:hypothetical protein [Bacilli bacterium]
MKLKEGVRKALNLILVYVIAGVLIFAMSERVERLNEQERLEKECNVAVKITK